MVGHRRHFRQMAREAGDPSSRTAPARSGQYGNGNKCDNKRRYSGHRREHDERQGRERALVACSSPVRMNDHPNGKKEGPQGDRQRDVQGCSKR